MYPRSALLFEIRRLTKEGRNKIVMNSEMIELILK